MRTAILSMQRIINYGSVLQAYSLKNMLEDITNEPVDFIDIETDRVVPARMPVKDSDDYKIKSNPTFTDRIRRKIFNKIRIITDNKIKAFMVESLGVNDTNNSKTYDLVVVGSDEVFKSIDTVNLQLYGDISQADFVATYAASCGAAKFEGILPETIDTIKAAMKNYIAMSVRDDGTEEYVRNLYDGEIERHLDPVLMGNLNARKHKKVPLNRYMIVYAYGGRIRAEEEIKAIKNYAKKHNLKTLAIGGYQYWCDLYIPMDPLRVLDYFYYADCIVTDTFHGSIFSVINHKKFATIIRKTNSNKVVDLLNTLGLSDRIVNNVCDLGIVLDADIEYNAIDSKLEVERKRSKEYLGRIVSDIQLKCVH